MSALGGVQGEPALPGRILLAMGLLTAGWFVIFDPGASVAVTVIVYAVSGAAVLGALVTAWALDLLGRGLAAVVVGITAVWALSKGGRVFATEREFTFLVVGVGLGVVSYALLFFFVHGVHRALRSKSSPLFLWAALLSVGLSLMVAVFPAEDLLRNSLGVAGPLALLAVSILRPSGRRGSVGPRE